MLYLLICNVTATPWKYYMTSKYYDYRKCLEYSSLAIISQVYFQSQGQCFPKE